MTKEQQFDRHKTGRPALNLNSNIPFPEEIAHFREIHGKLGAALHEADSSVDRLDKEYMDAKRYMVQYRGEIDPHEMFQNELALKQIDRSGAFTIGIRGKLVKMKESPYFARIDFQIEDSQEAAKYYIGRFTARADWIQSRFNAYRDYPVKKRLQMTADDIHDRFHTDNIMGNELPSPKTIQKSLNTMLKSKNTLALYKDFYKQMDITDMFIMPTKKILEWADVYPFLYLHAAFEGLQGSKVIKHLVIDEMQDYTPIQYVCRHKPALSLPKDNFRGFWSVYKPKPPAYFSGYTAVI